MYIEPLLEIRAPIGDWIAQPNWLAEPASAHIIERVKELADANDTYSHGVAVALLCRTHEMNAISWAGTRSYSEIRTLLDLAYSQAEVLLSCREAGRPDPQEEAELHLLRRFLAWIEPVGPAVP